MSDIPDPWMIKKIKEERHRRSQDGGRIPIRPGVEEPYDSGKNDVPSVDDDHERGSGWQGSDGEWHHDEVEELVAGFRSSML